MNIQLNLLYDLLTTPVITNDYSNILVHHIFLQITAETILRSGATATNIYYAMPKLMY
jgi:hypothetical protein